MFKKSALGAVVLAAGLILLAACGSVGSTSPQPVAHSNGHSVQKDCNVPQIPACMP